MGMNLLQMFLTTLSLLARVLSAFQQLKFIYKQPKVSAKSDVNLEIWTGRWDHGRGPLSGFSSLKVPFVVLVAVIPNPQISKDFLTCGC